MKNFVLRSLISGLILSLVVSFFSSHSFVAFAEDAPDEAAADDSKNAPDIAEDTPVTHEEMPDEKNLTSSRSWKAPDFSNQEGALGYNGPETFAVPKGMENQWQFWIDIYSKYTTDQGVLHDAENIDLVYEVLDFTEISSRTNLNNWQKEHIKLKQVKAAKLRVIQLLEKLHKTKDPSTLAYDEKRIWDYYQKIDEPNKFREAQKKNRLRFQLGQRDRVIQGIFFSGRYIDQFEQVFREAGLPIELTRLPFVESSYNVLARSKVGASGLWQIMPYTMKGFMKKDPSIDLRNHPIEATKLAGKLMRINYNMLQSWPLAMTGYNHGPSGILRLTKKYKTRELVDLIQNVNIKKRFGFASRNFYACFLAILEVTSNAPKYLGVVNMSQPLDSVEIKLGSPISYKDLLRWFDNDDLKVQIFNPHITKVARLKGHMIPKGIVVSVTKSKADLVMKETGSVEALKLARQSDVKNKAETKSDKSNSKSENKSDNNSIAGGDNKDASSAQTVGISESQESIKSDIKLDPSIVNPVSTDVAANSVEKDKDNVLLMDPSQQAQTNQSSSSEVIIYKVKNGDNLTRIAKRFKVKMEDVIADNNLQKNPKLRKGQKLKIQTLK